MAEFIEVTVEGSRKLLVNIDEIASVYAVEKDNGIKTVMWGRDDSCWYVLESYDSIKETLHLRGVNVFGVVNVDGPREVFFPRTWLASLTPILKAVCEEHKAKSDPCYTDCPLCDGDECIYEAVAKGELRHA